MPLSIPSGARAAAVKLLQFSYASQKELLSILKSTQPIYTPETFSKHLSSELRDQGADEIVRLLFGVYPLLDNAPAPSPSVLANDFVQALRELDGNAVSNVTEEEVEHFRQFLVDALSLRSTLGASAKALRLMRQYENVYGSAEIFSDLRSVFSPISPDEWPDAGIIVHQLKISSANSDDFFTAMDYSDLLQLKETVERALAKHKTLINMMKNFKLNYQEVEEEI